MNITKKNRREAYNKIIPERNKRKAMILAVLANGDSSGMTAEEIVDTLYKSGKIPSPDMNYVRPRLTEMKESGEVSVVGRRPSVRTGRNTAVWKVVKS